MPYELFDRSKLIIKPLAERVHDVTLAHQLSLDEPLDEPLDPVIGQLGEELVKAREKGASIIFMAGGHVIRAGVARHLIDLMERGLLTHIALNGSGPIHDWELALIGATCESVPRYVRSGEFGLWRETGRMNETIAKGYADGLGYGESLGKAILEGSFPNKELSVLAQAYRLKVPVTVHIGIGYDILHEHPNCDGAALGGASYRDFLAFCKSVENLERGVMCNFGTAVMGPEVYLKALAMARNVAHQEGRKIADFTTAVFDLLSLEGDPRVEQPKSHPQYYYRPWKTILVRTVADGGRSHYVQCEHRRSIPQLRAAALAFESR
ncbi:MAG TPA: hypothetical protein VKU82_15240 [Planctomycetaceae bacterium]|nr:hypothetical protein [Planctomycetaceae bacterium]